MKKRALLAVVLVLTPAILVTAIALNVDATPFKDDSWEIKAGDVSYKNANGEVVPINGIKFIDGAVKNKYEFPYANNKGIEFKIEKGCYKTWTSQKDSQTVTNEKDKDWCLVPYNGGKRMTAEGKGVDGMIGASAVSKKTNVINAMVNYLKANGGNIPNVTEVAKKDKNGNFKWEKADGKGDPANGAVNAEDDDPNSESESSCYDGGGALGWVLCPIVIQFSEWMTSLYEGFVEPAMQIESSLIFGEPGQEGTYTAWVMFRNIANLIFIMMFLFVIFSQLTGIGIDNYGIKKALPKLIVMAVLINLSFIICALVVDVSNILGYGLKEMLFNLSESITIPNDDLNNASLGTGGKVLSWGIVIAGLLTTGAGIAAVWANPAIVITACIAVLAAFISLMFLFVILAVRKAVIVLLVATAPIAIAFYSLPNTKSIFDKWFGIFKAMLLVFPTVGLLMGGGQLASTIILAANDGEQFFLWLVGMIVSLAPIFFVPAIVRSSLGALGTVGARIAGFGNTLSSGARNRMTQSDFNKTAQKLGERRRLMRRAGVKSVDEKGNVTYTRRGVRQNSSRSRISNSITGERRGRLMKELKDEGRFESFASEGGFSAAMQRAVGDTARREAVDDMITNMKADTNNFDSNTMADMLADELSGDHAINEVKAQALMEKLAESSYGTKLLAGMMSDGSNAVYKNDVSDSNGNIIHKKGEARISSAGMDFMATTMAKSGTIGGAVARKDGAAAQYMRERNVAVAQDKRALAEHIQNGGTEGSFHPSERTDFSSWYQAPSAVDSSKTNAQFVADDITDDNAGFAAQNDHAIARAMGEAGAGRNTGSVISRERAYAMTQNRQINETATEGALTNIYRQAGVQRPTGANNNGETFTDGAGI